MLNVALNSRREVFQQSRNQGSNVSHALPLIEHITNIKQYEAFLSTEQKALFDRLAEGEYVSKAEIDNADNTALQVAISESIEEQQISQAIKASLETPHKAFLSTEQKVLFDGLAKGEYVSKAEIDNADNTALQVAISESIEEQQISQAIKASLEMHHTNKTYRPIQDGHSINVYLKKLQEPGYYNSQVVDIAAQTIGTLLNQQGLVLEIVDKRDNESRSSIWKEGTEIHGKNTIGIDRDNNWIRLERNSDHFNFIDPKTSKVIPIAADGDCLFSSVLLAKKAIQTRSDSYLDAFKDKNYSTKYSAPKPEILALRKQVVAHIRENIETYQPFFVST